MNYSTFKKAIVFSLVAALGLTEVSFAQNATSSSAQVFGGRAQYRTWNLGINAGVTAPALIIGGINDFKWEANLGWGASLRKQLGHAFGLELGFNTGKLSGNIEDASEQATVDRESYETKLSYAASIAGVVNVATVDFLRRENAVNFFAKAGLGLNAYKWTSVVSPVHGELKPAGGFKYGSNGDHDNVRGMFVPVGVGVKFKVSDRVNFDLGYTMNFLDADNLDGTYGKYPSSDKWSYSYAGLEFSLGSSSKPNLDWVNPVALMYDELKDPALRQEVEALKNRVSTIESQDLLKDSDGDGVADALDKCPNTEAGVKVDGSGCPLDVDGDGIPDSKDACPLEKGTAEYNGCPAPSGAGGSTIQFEFDSSVLKTEAYPVLDKLSSELRSNASASVQLDGHASAEGTDEYNMQLSRDRANSVKTYLVNSGVAANRISVTAYGESRPVASNATEAGRIQNRRVEFRK